MSVCVCWCRAWWMEARRILSHADWKQSGCGRGSAYVWEWARVGRGMRQDPRPLSFPLSLIPPNKGRLSDHGWRAPRGNNTVYVSRGGDEVSRSKRMIPTCVKAKYPRPACYWSVTYRQADVSSKLVRLFICSSTSYFPLALQHPIPSPVPSIHTS